MQQFNVEEMHITVLYILLFLKTNNGGKRDVSKVQDNFVPNIILQFLTFFFYLSLKKTTKKVIL